MPKRTNPADVANLFIRCFLSDVGEALGGCSNLQWRKTLEYFDFCCAYTGKPVTEATAVMDHAISMNKRHCGLHLFGNLVPAYRPQTRRNITGTTVNFSARPKEFKGSTNGCA